MTDEQAFEITKTEYEGFFDEAIKAFQVLPEGTLGEKGSEEESAATALLEELKLKKNETAEFSPELPVLRLRKKDFSDLGIELPEETKKLMSQNRFYLVRIPITLVPRPGNLFWRLMCVIELNPDSESRRPTAVSLFPEEQWQTIIQALVGAEVGVDESLKFKAEIDPAAAQAGSIAGEFDAGVEMLLSGALNVTVGKFNYNVQRPTILARGKDSAKVRWTLDGKEPFKEDDLNLGLVMKVPNEVEEVTLAGALLAYRDFETLMAEMKDIWDRIKGYLSPKSQEFFNLGAPLPDKHDWVNITHGT